MTGARELLDAALAIVLDFDGTLVDSNEIKFSAFERCFAEHPHRLAEIIAYCRGSHHTPRSAKFRHVYETILRLPYTNDVEAMISLRFAEATTEQIVAAREIPGAARFLREAPRGRPVCLLSSTPHEVLLEIVGRRGWSRHFAEVRGAPVDKGTWIPGFCRAAGVDPARALFFGDTAEDVTAANAAGCAFVAVATRVAPVFIADFSEVLRETGVRA